MSEPTPDREPRSGALAAALGGLLGLVTLPAGLLAIDILTVDGGVGLDAEARLTAVALLLSFGVVLGTPLGFAGAAVAKRIRRRRHAEWSDDRTAFVGAYLAGAFSSLCCCPMLGFG